MGLRKYHQKRNFERTKEPKGKKIISKKTKHLYVIQKHAASHLHYDFRLELSGVLLSWAVPKGPSLDPKVKHLAMQVEDHPIDYARFEGIIPQGEYGGGTVMVWDIGRWESLDENVNEAYRKGNLTFNLYGKKLKGQWKLIKLKQSSENKQPWLLFKLKDEYSNDENTIDIKQSEPDSVLTNRSMEQIAKQKKRIWTSAGEINKKPKKISGAIKSKIPLLVSPELATLVTEPPKGDKWLHEIKWDGYRLISRINHSDIKLLTRQHNDWTHHFPSIKAALHSLKLKDCILDGEVIALDKEQKANFQLLQNSMDNSHVQVDMIYYVFDLLFYDGYNLMNAPLIERKKILHAILQKKSVPEIQFNDHIIGNGEKVYQNACDYSLEGIISKKADSKYLEKRTKDWLKIKCTRRQEFVIGGYTDPKSSRQYFGALLLGYYKEGKLIYCGRVGTGFNQVILKETFNKLTSYRQNINPFHHFPGRIPKDVHWLKPYLVAEIEFLNMTSEGVLRHPSFKGLRDDKKSKEVRLELPLNINEIKMPKSNRIKFTHLERVLYPQQGLTKHDLISYYELVADWMLPYIKNRPLTVVRCPSGNHKHCFYQKHVNESVPSVINTIEILEHDEYAPYISINNLDGLLGLVQMGVLEIHPWGSNNKNIEKPDTIIFDLDPAPEVSWKQVVECANLMHQFLDFLKLRSFVKTTGGKGLHIVIPVKPHLTWVEIRTITKRIADIMVEIHPDKYIATMSKAKRVGKIFIDYLRNTRGATAIAPYSTRAKPHAPVAVPIAWEELADGIKSDIFNVMNINERLKHLRQDPWKDYFKTKQTITAKIRKMLDNSFH